MATQTLSDLALDHYSDRQKLVTATSTVAGQMWSDVDPKRIVESWAEQVPELTAVVTGAQLGAARPAVKYTDESLAEQEVEPEAVADPDPAGFAGHAADGRGLVSLLSNPVFVTLASIQDGFDILNAMSHGRHNLDMIVSTEVADAGRLADQVSLTSRKGAHGYIRMAVGNSCARCLILAGREYTWSAGFQRHPKCDCIHIPSGIAKAGLRSLMPDPEAMYARMTAAERTRAGFTLADQRAIADGADINQVVNAHRGMYTVGSGPSKRKLTNESTTRRGVVKRRQRLSVDECYRVAAGDRDEALALLRQNGYLFDGGPKVVQPAIPLPVAAEVDPALKMTLADLKAIARQNNVPIAGLTKKPDIVARLREFEAGNGRLSALPEFAPKPTGPAVVVKPIKAPAADATISGQGQAGGWTDLIPEPVPPDGLRARNMEIFPDGAQRSYVVKHGTVVRDPDGVVYLVEHGPDEYGSERVARALAEMRQAHATIPAAGRANKSYAYLTRENPYDDHYRVKYNNPTHESSMSASEGRIVMWNRQKWARVNTSEVRHETGHNLDHLVGRETRGSQSPSWNAATNADTVRAREIRDFESQGRITIGPDPSRDFPRGVTEYGKSSAAEDYAESVMLYQLGPIARGRMPGETAVRDLYFRDLFPERARMLDREFPELAAQQRAAIEALKAPVGRSLKDAQAEFARLSRESAKGAKALKATPLRMTQPGDLHKFEGFDVLGADASRVQKSLIQYERSGFKHLNNWLRTGKVGTTGPFPLTEAELKAMLADLNRAFEQSRLTEAVTVYRGLDTGRGIFGDGLSGDLSGFEWTEKGMFSTSASKAVAEDFGGVQLRIVVPQDQRALVLSGMGREAEAEILLPAGMRFRVVKDRGVVGGKRMLDVEVVPAEGAAQAVTTTATKVAKSEITPEQTIRDLLAGKGTAPKILTSGPTSGGYAGATLDELRVLAESRYGHLGKIAPKATREQLLAALRAEQDLTDSAVFKREAARLLQLRVERGQALADVLGEAAEMVFKRATPEAMRRNIEAIARSIATARTPVPPAFLRDVLKAIESGDRAKVEAALRRIGQKYKIRLDGMAGDISKAREGMEFVGGSGFREGVEVRVTRPGAVIELPNGETARLRMTVVREVDAAERARIRQEAIDEVRKRADVLTEVNELIANGADRAVIRERLGIRLKRAGLESDADLKAFIRAVESGDPAKIAKASQAAAKKLNLTQVNEAGSLAAFDPKKFQAIAGSRIGQGAQVRVVRPGFEFTLKGEKITLSKPVVEELSDAEIAQLRQQAVDTARGLVDLQAELAGGPAQRRIAIEASVLPDDIKAKLLAASKVSPAKLKTTLTAELKKRGVVVGKAPKTPVKFDPKTMEVKGGAKLPVGTKVRVVEPEVTVVHQGETVVVRKAVVEPPMPTFRSSTAPSIKTLFFGPDPEPAIARAIDGAYRGGVKAKVTDVSRSSSRIEIEGDLYSSSGKIIGQFERKFIKRQDGTWEAHHEVLTIREQYQGSGFAADFNANLYDWYRRSGFDQVTLDANIDVGGYAWATQGFDFASDSAMVRYADEATAKLDWLDGHGKYQPSFGISHDQMTPADFRRLFPGTAPADFQQQSAAFRQLLEDVRAGRRKVTAYELSQFGRKAGQGRDDWWIGKMIMLGHELSWPGVMPL